MLKIYICEDNLSEQKKIIDIIKKTIVIEEYDMAIAFVTTNPYELLNMLSASPLSSPGIYFLDIDFKLPDFNGIKLGSRIRELDPRGFIIFISSLENQYRTIFDYKVEAMDYISKNEQGKLKQKISQCLQRANKLYLAATNTVHKFFRFKVGSRIVTLPMDSIVYFESSKTPHRIIAHTASGTSEFYSTLKALREQADKNFRLAHRGCLVNTAHIISVDFNNLILHFDNGEACPVSGRSIKDFK